MGNFQSSDEDQGEVLACPCHNSPRGPERVIIGTPRHPPQHVKFVDQISTSQGVDSTQDVFDVNRTTPRTNAAAWSGGGNAILTKNTSTDKYVLLPDGSQIDVTVDAALQKLGLNSTPRDSSRQSSQRDPSHVHAECQRLFMPEHESEIAHELSHERQRTITEGIHSNALAGDGSQLRGISPPSRTMTPRSLAHQIYPPRFTTPQDVYRSMAPATPRSGGVTPRDGTGGGYMPPLEPGHIVI